jgi:predicted dehydrogenase
LDISRADFFEKEITFQVSCSYGPGRYDDAYEQKGQDYPIGHVRWTEKRNFEAVLQALSKKILNVQELITERVPLREYYRIYGSINESNSIASLLLYDEDTSHESVVVMNKKSFKPQKGIIGIVGAGNYTSSTLLPNLRKIGANIKYIASFGGLSSTLLSKKYGVSNATTDYLEILKDPEVDLVIIATRHDMHASMVLAAIEAGKSVFVEKPLAIMEADLEEIIKAYRASEVCVSVGFNRRFAPLALKMKRLLGSNEIPINMVATMNAGMVPADVWVHDMEVGGGRILGEAAHYIDLCTFLAGSNVVSVCMNAMGVHPKENTDNASILLKYANGSNAVINYFANGSKAYSKERVEVYSQERTLVLDNWRKLRGYGFTGFTTARSKQDKGHYDQFRQLLERQKNGGEPIIPFEEIVNSTKASFAALQSLKQGAWVTVE